MHGLTVCSQMDDLLFFESAPTTKTSAPPTTRALPTLPPKPPTLQKENLHHRHATALSARCGTVYCCGSAGLCLKPDRRHGELVPMSDELDSVHKVLVKSSLERTWLLSYDYTSQVAAGAYHGLCISYGRRGGLYVWNAGTADASARQCAAGVPRVASRPCSRAAVYLSLDANSD